MMLRLALAMALAASPARVSGGTDSLRVAVLGDGTAGGFGLPDAAADSWPGQLGVLLGADRDVRYFGSGPAGLLRSGEASVWRDPALEDALLFAPRALFVSLGAFDSAPWNWTDAASFTADAKALLDTLASVPGLFVCRPLPAFENLFGVQDDLLSGPVAAGLDSAARQGGAGVVDFRSPFLGLPERLPDGVHPDIEASRIMALSAYSALSGRPAERAPDPDLARGAFVASDVPGAGALVDGDALTAWTVAAFPGSAVFDLGAPEAVDLFQADLGEDRSRGILFSVDVSPDSVIWLNAAPPSAPPDRSTVMAERRTPAVTGRYVRLTVAGALYGPPGPVSLRAFHVRRAGAPGLRGPMVTWTLVSLKNNLVKYLLHVQPSGPDSLPVILYRSLSDSSPLGPLAGYRLMGSTSFAVLAKPGQTHRYLASAFADGREAVSDTVEVKLALSAAEGGGGPAVAPETARLFPAYPNPFNAGTRISFELRREGRVRLEVFDCAGRRVRGLEDGRRNAGRHSVYWDGRDETGRPVPSGVYGLRLEADGAVRLVKTAAVR